MKQILALFAALSFMAACTDFDEQVFTVLLPDAGEDQVVFTETNGDTISLDGSKSSDVNKIGFNYEWSIESQPEGFSANLVGFDTPKPKLAVDSAVSGRYVLSLIISIGDQRARDFVNIDVNPLNAQLLFVHGIEDNQSATLNIPDAEIEGNAIQPLSADSTYYNINLNLVKGDSVTLFVDYGGSQLQTKAKLNALGSYTLYLIGSASSAELYLVEKTLNQNTLFPTTVGLEFINLAPNTNGVELWIDATIPGQLNFGDIPLDNLLEFLGSTTTFGEIDYKANNEILLLANQILPLPIWAQVNADRISNDAANTLPPGVEKNFGTFILFPDSSAEFNHTLKFINNSNLLPE